MADPGRPPERRTSHRVLHQVVEQTVAAAEFPFPVALHIPRGAQPRSDLVIPSKIDWIADAMPIELCAVRRHELPLETYAQGQRQIVTHAPGVLDIQAMVSTQRLA